MTPRRPPARFSAARVAGCVAGVAVVVDSARRARRRRVGATEAQLFHRFNDRTDRIAAPVWMIMQSGSLGAVFAAAGIVAHRRGLRRAGLVGIAGTAVWIGAKAIKPVVGRGRPDEYLDVVVVRGAPQRGLGYPSGHAAVALTLALMLPAAMGRSPSSVERALAAAVVGATGAARMYVGAHLPLDVLGGLALGTGAGLAGSALLPSVKRDTSCRVR